MLSDQSLYCNQERKLLIQRDYTFKVIITSFSCVETMCMLQTRCSLDVPGLGARLLVLLCTVEASLYQTHWSLFPAWVRVSIGLFLSISSLLIYQCNVRHCGGEPDVSGHTMHTYTIHNTTGPGAYLKQTSPPYKLATIRLTASPIYQEVAVHAANTFNFAPAQTLESDSNRSLSLSRVSCSGLYSAVDSQSSRKYLNALI